MPPNRNRTLGHRLCTGHTGENKVCQFLCAGQIRRIRTACRQRIRKRVLTDKRTCRDRAESIAFQNVAQFNQRIVVVSVSVQDNRYCRSILTGESGLNKRQKQIGNASGIHRNTENHQFVFRKCGYGFSRPGQRKINRPNRNIQQISSTLCNA